MADRHRPVCAVVFDIGETLRDDTNEFGAWADWLGVPRHTFSALLGAVRARGGTTDDAFRCLRRDFDLDEQRRLRAEAGMDEQMSEADLYPDVRPVLRELRDMGLWVGIAGNQSAHCGDLLRALALPVDAVHTSGEWKARKPDAAFFACLLAVTPHPASRILYVGDHWEHDILAASAAGLQTAFLRRGPWGHLRQDEPSAGPAPTYRISGLAELPVLLRSMTPRAHDLWRSCDARPAEHPDAHRDAHRGSDRMDLRPGPRRVASDHRTRGTGTP